MPIRGIHHIQYLRTLSNLFVVGTLGMYAGTKKSGMSEASIKIHLSVGLGVSKIKLDPHLDPNFKCKYTPRVRS